MLKGYLKSNVVLKCSFEDEICHRKTSFENIRIIGKTLVTNEQESEHISDSDAAGVTKLPGEGLHARGGYINFMRNS